MPVIGKTVIVKDAHGCETRASACRKPDAAIVNGFEVLNDTARGRHKNERVDFVQRQDGCLISGLRQFEMRPLIVSGAVARTRHGTVKPAGSVRRVPRCPSDIFVAEFKREIPILKTVLSRQVCDDQLKGVQPVGIGRVIADIIPCNGKGAIVGIEIVPNKIAAGRRTARCWGHRATTGIDIGPKREYARDRSSGNCIGRKL